MANYIQNGINFNNVKDGGKLQESSPIWTGQVGVDEFGGIINAVDIDWNTAKIRDAVTALTGTDGQITEGTPVENINTTGDLLYTIANLQAQVTVLTNLVWNAPNDLVLKTIQM